MRGMVGSIGRWGGILPAALALLLLFKLLVPAGYMIAAGRDGGPGFVLCETEARASAETNDHEGHDRPPADQAPANSGERPCAFAALGAPPLPPPSPALPSQAPAAAVPPDLPEAPALRRVAAAAPPPPATGPPLNV